MLKSYTAAVYPSNLAIDGTNIMFDLHSRAFVHFTVCEAAKRTITNSFQGPLYSSKMEQTRRV